MKKDKLLAGAGLLIFIAVFVYLPKAWESKWTNRKGLETIGPKLQNPLYLAVFSGISSDKFAMLVASNSQWINRIDEAFPQPLLCVAADFGLTNDVIILMQNGANVQDSLAYASKYSEYSSNAVAVIRHCQQLSDAEKGNGEAKSP